MEQVWQNLINSSVEIAKKLLFAAIVLVVGIFLIKFIIKIFTKSKKSEKFDPIVVTFINSFIKITLYIVLVISVVAILGVPMASIIALLASGGVAIGLALQGSLSNFAGGIMLLIFRPFTKGDVIESSGQSGVVDSIGIFYTKIISFDNKHITIPNSTLTSATIINYNVESRRRVDIAFNVAYGTDIEKVKKIVLAMVGEHEKILKDPAPFLRMTNMKDSSLEFTLRFWCAPSDIVTAKSDILEQMHDIFAHMGIVIPFNQLDINIKNIK